MFEDGAVEIAVAFFESVISLLSLIGMRTS